MGNSYRDLIVWQKAKMLAISVYRVTAAFPEREAFGLTAQMRRAAISVPSNIAEGQGRNSKTDFARFLSIARGSVLELATQAEIADALKFGESSQLLQVLADGEEVLFLLNRLLKTLSQKTRS